MEYIISFLLGASVSVITCYLFAIRKINTLSELTFSIIQKYVTQIITVSEREIIDAMRIVWERMKIIIEPSCAVPLAAVLKEKSGLKNKKVGVILTGGNVDLEQLPWLKK